MQKNAEEFIERYKKEHSKKQKVFVVFFILSLFVVTGVFWQLKIKGIALAGEAFCGQKEHVHSEKCMECVLVCNKEESEGHQHTEECYDEQKALVCEKPEEEGHTHSETCYEMRQICGEKEHIHNVMCYSDKKADLETASVWESGLPTEFTENWAENLIVTAHTQLGYKESSRNYILAEDGETKKGYSRYGAWYGNAYGDWCAMFVSFCLNYAEIPQEAIPYEAGCHTWTVKLKQLGLYEKPEEYTPVAGDIIFFDYDHVGKSHHVGIVTKLEKRENEQIIIHTIEGNSSNSVREKTYSLSDPDIIGYGNLAKAKERYDKLTNPEAYAENEEIAAYELNGEIVVNGAGAFKQAFVKANESKTVKLNADFEVEGTIDLARISEIGLDLNGHKLTVKGSNVLFNVPAGSTLIITDSLAKQETTVNQGGNVYGNVGTYTENNLTYYVTESKVMNTSTGATQETLKKYDVPLGGRIRAGDATVVNLTGGTVDLESGMLYDGKNRAFNVSGGILDLKGGYIFGFNKNENGAAIYANGNSVINLSGSVLTANESTGKTVKIGCGGAIAAVEKTIINITGGIISGNKADGIGSWEGNEQCGGGGIYCGGNVTVTMSGGYLTNNYVGSERYFDGGGGLFLTGTSKFTLSNGYITGNQAQGGGGIKTDFGKSPRVTINGGFISSNTATTAEGGGVTIDRNGAGYFNGGYITNNKILNTVHWGGGGLFCADGADLFLKKALITENEAGGFGGGVAGCPTGKIYLYIDEGCAIYNNADVVNGEIHYVNGGVKDGIDVERCDTFFQSHGHKDYFCALNSTVTGTMLGNYPANWEGSADGTAVKLGGNDAQTATSVMGLESHPTKEGIASAQQNAAVYVNGNYSYTHGGGILCNGNLIVGNPTDIEIPAHLGLKATKVLLDASGNKVSDLSDYNFQFEILDSNKEVVSKAVCDENGEIVFDTISFDKGGTYVYTIREIKDDSKPGINYDTTEYRLTVTVTEQKTPLYEATKTAYLITNTKVEKYDANGEWKTISNNNYGNAKDNLALLLTGAENTFVNTTESVSKITVIKKWADNIIGADSVTVDLYKDGAVYKTVVLDKDNNWTYTWTDLSPGYYYEVKERELKGYIASYETSNLQGKPSDYWVPASSLEVGKQYMIVSGSGNKALYISQNHQNHGVDNTDVKDVTKRTGTMTVGGTSYSAWYDADEIDSRCIFTAQERVQNNNKGIILKSKGASANTWLLVQNADSNYLKSTSGNNYASFMVFENGTLKGQDGYNWNPNNLRTVIYSDDKFNTSTDKNNAAKLYTLVSEHTSGSSIITITNTPREEEDYELPETGGTGIFLYIGIGLLLMAVSMIKIINKQRR